MSADHGSFSEVRLALKTLLDSNQEIKDRVVATRVYTEERLDKLDASVASLVTAVLALQQALGLAANASSSSGAPAAKRFSSDHTSQAAPAEKVAEEVDDEADDGAGDDALPISSFGSAPVGFKRGRAPFRAAGLSTLPPASLAGQAASPASSRAVTRTKHLPPAAAEDDDDDDDDNDDALDGDETAESRSRGGARSAVSPAAALRRGGRMQERSSSGAPGSGATSAKPNTRSTTRSEAAAMKPDPGAAAMSECERTAPKPEHRMRLYVQSNSFDETLVICSPDTRVVDIIRAVLKRTGGGDERVYRLTRSDGFGLEPGSRVEQCDLETEDRLLLLMVQVGGMMHETSGRWGLDSLQ